MDRPRRKTLLILRACMSVVALGSLFGMVEHLANNAEFYLEIHPSATVLETIAAALGGANPLVAPGILAVAAIIAVAATYAHPALKPHPGAFLDDDPSSALRSPFDFPFGFAQGVAQGMAQGAVVTREERRLPLSH